MRLKITEVIFALANCANVNPCTKTSLDTYRTYYSDFKNVGQLVPCYVSQVCPSNS